MAGGYGEVMYYKGLKPNLFNCGLNRAKPLQYRINEWVYPDCVSDSKVKDGLWVAKNKSFIRWYIRYVRETRGYTPIVYECEIGAILYETSNRVKTDKVKITRRFI